VCGGFHHAVPLGSLGQGQHGMGHGFQATIFVERPDILPKFRRDRRLESIGPRAQRRSGQGQPLEHYRQEVELDLAGLLEGDLHEPALDRDIALKVLPAQFLHDPSFRERFEREAKVVAKLEHRNIVPIHAFGVDEEMPWMAMRLVSGQNAFELRKAAPLPPRRVVAILRDVADRFPGIEVVRLPVNHRCTPQIVQIGARALHAGEQDAAIESARPDGETVDIVRHADETAEATWVASSIARLDPTLVRTARVAVLARTHAALAPTRQALHDIGVATRRPVEGAGSVLTPLLTEAYRLGDNNRLREWAFDHADAADGEDDPAGEVARAVLAFLREHPTGDGGTFRTWVMSNDPFGGDLPGVELLTFHAAKGREWHTVHLVGCETSLVPHRSATTIVARAEESRLLYVALTRATDRLTVNWAERRHGYLRKLTPFLDGFESEAPPLLPPPEELVSMTRSHRSLTLERLHEWRAAAARAAGILPDAVCTDQMLGLIAEHRPGTAAELDELTGLGALTSARLFGRIQSALSDVPVGSAAATNSPTQR